MDKRKIKNILLVCTGNSCRSIMAEGYLSKRLKDLGKDIQAASAGTGAISGLRPTEEAIKVMKEIDIDVSDYTSTVLTKESIDKADVILVMDPIHREAIRRMDPFTKDKIFYLREFAKKNEEDKFIPDPIGKPIEYYQRIFELLKESIEGFLKWLEE